MQAPWERREARSRETLRNMWSDGAMRRVGRAVAEEPKTALVLAGAVVLGGVLRFAALGARGWWRDEAVTVELLRLPFDELLRTIPDSEGTPPLYYVVAWGWTRVLGDSEVGLRSLSALLGTVTVLVVFLAGRELVSTRTGLVAAWLAAASPLLVWHSQDGRSYALLVLLGALSFLFFARLLRAPSRADAVGFGLASGLALLTHYFAVFLVLPEAVWLLARRRTWRLAIAPLAVVGAIGLALVPLAQAQRGNVSWISEVSRARRLIEVPQEFFVGPQAPWERGTTVLAGVLAVAAVALLLAVGSRKESRAIRPAAATGLAALAFPLLLALGGLDYVLARNVLVAWVPLSIVVAAGLAARRAGVAGVVLAGAIVVLGTAVVVASASSPKFDAEDWRGAARALGPPPPGGRAIAIWPDAGATPFLVYRPAARALTDEGALVTELVVAAFGPRRRESNLLGALAPPRPPFEKLEQQDEAYFTLIRYVTEEPFLARPESWRSAPSDPKPALLIEH